MCISKSVAAILSHYQISSATKEHEEVYDYGVIGALEDYFSSCAVNYTNEYVQLDEHHYIAFFTWPHQRLPFSAPSTLILFCEMEASSIG